MSTLYEKLILGGGTEALAEGDTGGSASSFEEYAHKALDAGATHLTVSGMVSKSRWEITDPDDPYLFWSIHNPCVFKFCVPPELSSWIPQEYADKNMDLIKRRCEVLEKVGLKGAFFGYEPMYWDESIFRKNPEWRGPRVDQPRRTKHPYFSPCVDHPEVLAIYRRTMKTFFNQVPVIDTMSYYTNDSGAGLCWSEYLYNNPNGPAWCQLRGFAKRITGFLQAFIDGAKDAGVDLEIFFRAKGDVNEGRAMEMSVKPGMGFEGASYLPVRCNRIFRAGTGQSIVAKALPTPGSFIKSLQAVIKGGKKKVVCNVGSGGEDSAQQDRYLAIIKRLIDTPVSGTRGRVNLLHDLAVEEVGEDHAETLEEFWEAIEAGQSAAAQSGIKFHLTVTAERWLTRPLLPFPLELSADEKAYYRKFQFQANSEEEAADYMNMEAHRIIDGHTSASYLCGHIGRAIGGFSKARSLLSQLRKNVGDNQEYKTWDERLAATICILKTSAHTIEFAGWLDMHKQFGDEEVCEIPYRTEYIHERKAIYEVFRKEVDNAGELIGVLEKAESQPIPLAPTSDEEDVFTFGPDLVDQLRRKVDLMCSHWMDFDRLYVRPNR